MFVPVIDTQGKPLMPTTPARARKWLKSSKAAAFWKGGLFCVRLNVEPSARETQPIAVGIDPGSKLEGYSIISAAHTYLNLQAEQKEAPAVYQSTLAVEAADCHASLQALPGECVCRGGYSGRNAQRQRGQVEPQLLSA